jgi:hypothetical protein
LRARGEALKHELSAPWRQLTESSPLLSRSDKRTKHGDARNTPM